MAFGVETNMKQTSPHWPHKRDINGLSDLIKYRTPSNDI